MKLNFWQWLGVVLLVIGAVLYYARKKSEQPRTLPAPAGTQPTPSITTQP